MSDDLFLDAPSLDTMPLCEECGEHLLPAERECCADCQIAYEIRLLAWIKGDADPDISLAFDGVRPRVH